MSLDTSHAKHASRHRPKQPQILAFHPELKIPEHRLPFVGKEHVEGKSFSFWNVPAKGGYHGGVETGKALAVMFLKHRRESESDPSGTVLGWMVQCWMERIASGDIKGGGPEFESLRGQMVGFMGVISGWVDVAARELGSNLDKTTNEALLNQANGGLNFDEEAFVKRIAIGLESAVNS